MYYLTILNTNNFKLINMYEFVIFFFYIVCNVVTQIQCCLKHDIAVSKNTISKRNVILHVIMNRVTCMIMIYHMLYCTVEINLIY